MIGNTSRPTYRFWVMTRTPVGRPAMRSSSEVASIWPSSSPSVSSAASESGAVRSHAAASSAQPDTSAIVHVFLIMILPVDGMERIVGVARRMSYDGRRCARDAPSSSTGTSCAPAG